MKGTLVLVLLLTLISFNESSISLGGLLGGGLLSGSLLGGGLLKSDFISQILRADIIDTDYFESWICTWLYDRQKV